MTTTPQHVSADGKYRVGNGEFKNQVALTEIGDRIVSTVWLPEADGSFETFQVAPGRANDARPVTNFTEADALKTHAEFVAALVERLNR